MTRHLRLEFNGAISHITSRGDRQEEAFDDDEDRVKFLEILDADAHCCNIPV